MKPADRRETARRPIFETRLYALIPAPPLLVTLLVAALAFGAYAGLCLAFDVSIFNEQQGLNDGAKIVLILSGLLAAAIDLPERARRIWIDEAESLKATVSEAGLKQVDGLGVGQPRSITASVWLWFVCGAALGLGFSVLSLLDSDRSLGQQAASPALWGLIVAPLLFGLGARAVRLMSEDDRTLSKMAADHLDVEFADLDRLHVYGRVGLRTALIWLVMAGLILAFLALQASALISAIALALAVCAALWSMLSVTRPVAVRVEKAKAAALIQVRRQLIEASSSARIGTGEAADLAAYEAWLASRPVWPISAPVTRRLALYGLIPVLAWFGAAAAELVLGQVA